MTVMVTVVSSIQVELVLEDDFSSRGTLSAVHTKNLLSFVMRHLTSVDNDMLSLPHHYFFYGTI